MVSLDKSILSGILVCSMLLSASFSFAQSETKDDMRVFLSSCAYGTGMGAGVGLVSLAFAEDPSSRMNNIARGASFGLYAGIGVGLYLMNSRKTGSVAELPNWLVLPIYTQEKIDGGKVLFNLARY